MKSHTSLLILTDFFGNLGKGFSLFLRIFQILVILGYFEIGSKILSKKAKTKQNKTNKKTTLEKAIYHKPGLKYTKLDGTADKSLAVVPRIRFLLSAKSQIILKSNCWKERKQYKTMQIVNENR